MRRSALVVVAALLSAIVFPVVSGADALRPDAVVHMARHGHGTTVTGTVSGDHAWDPKHQRPYKAVPSVTVDQTTNLTDQVVHVTWKNFTPSDDQAGDFFSYGLTYYAVTVLECRGTNPRSPHLWKWPDFGPDCYNFTADNANAAHGAGNQVYTLTGHDGAGEVYFHVETGIENDYLGCDATHPCSLVVVPNWGGVQNPGSAPGSPGVNCKDHSDDVGLIFGNYALDDHLGDACSWPDRLVVPLHFAPTPTSCPAKNFQFAAEGAPALGRTFDQWRTGWCTGKDAVNFDFNSGTNEDLARQAFLKGSGALTSSVDVAVVNRPADPAQAKARKFVYAPVSNSAIAVAYHVDNQKTGKLITKLTLDARLVAKLLTQSYSLAFNCTQGGNTHKQGATCDPAVKGNPIDIFDDPEFHKLNPQYTRADFPPVSDLNRGQFLPLVINGNSDMVWELTNWLWSDPAARGFLQGKTDPWGMHVNTYYKNEPMPTDQFQVLDPGYTAPESNNVPGQSTMQVTWNPITGMANVAGSLVTDRPSGIDPVLPPCGTNGVPCVYQRFGSRLPGQRALFAIVGSVDAAADRFPAARLVNAAGKAVGPTNAAMRAGLSVMRTNADGITQTAAYRSKNAQQYPMTAVNYAMVPTCGLTASKVSAIQTFLHHVVSAQHPGLLPGQLAPGDLPLTQGQRAQTDAAAKDASAVSCTKRKRSGGRHPHQHHNSHRSPSGGGGNAPPPPVPAGGGSTMSTPSDPAPSSAAASTAPPSTAQATPSSSPAAFGYKPADSGIGTGMVLPVTLALAALLFIGGPAAYVFVSSGTGERALSRVRRRR